MPRTEGNRNWFSHTVWDWESEFRFSHLVTSTFTYSATLLFLFPIFILTGRKLRQTDEKLTDRLAAVIRITAA